MIVLCYIVLTVYKYMCIHIITHIPHYNRAIIVDIQQDEINVAC